MGLSLPVTTMRVFHIMSADETMRPNEMTWSKICRARMRFKLANMSPNILLQAMSRQWRWTRLVTRESEPRKCCGKMKMKVA